MSERRTGRMSLQPDARLNAKAAEAHEIVEGLVGPTDPLAQTRKLLAWAQRLLTDRDNWRNRKRGGNGA